MANTGARKAYEELLVKQAQWNDQVAAAVELAAKTKKREAVEADLRSYSEEMAEHPPAPRWGDCKAEWVDGLVQAGVATCAFLGHTYVTGMATTNLLPTSASELTQTVIAATFALASSACVFIWHLDRIALHANTGAPGLAVPRWFAWGTLVTGLAGSAVVGLARFWESSPDSGGVIGAITMMHLRMLSSVLFGLALDLAVGTFAACAYAKLKWTWRWRGALREQEKLKKAADREQEEEAALKARAETVIKLTKAATNGNDSAGASKSAVVGKGDKNE